ncbi:ECF transporter S component [Streptococcus dentapri]|uniref:Riboflavin transporter n=1 Tax=Streptococcus dentapri TaxID=573564 RepID=A0ABV8CYZ1_9STRE
MSTTTHTTRRLAYIAILSTVSFLLMYVQFPLIPGADFLQFEFSILPVLLALVIFDLKSAFAVLTLRTLLKFLLNNGGVGTLIGLPMNYIALSLFVFALALIWKKKQTVASYILAGLVGTLALTAAMFLLNYVYAVPLYAAFAHFDIKTMLGLGNYLFMMVIPFNLLEGLIFSVSFAALYAAIRPIIAKL